MRPTFKLTGSEANKTPNAAVILAYRELKEVLSRPGSVPLEEMQAGAEYLLDAIKVAQQSGLRAVVLG